MCAKVYSSCHDQPSGTSVCLWNIDTVLLQLYPWTTLFTTKLVNCIVTGLAQNRAITVKSWQIQCKHSYHGVKLSRPIKCKSWVSLKMLCNVSGRSFVETSHDYWPNARCDIKYEQKTIDNPTFANKGADILVPSATCLKMSLSSSSGRTKKFEFFHWLTKKECAAEMKITKLYAFHFTSGPVDSSLARFTNAEVST